MEGYPPWFQGVFMPFGHVWQSIGSIYRRPIPRKLESWQKVPSVAREAGTRAFFWHRSWVVRTLGRKIGSVAWSQDQHLRGQNKDPCLIKEIAQEQESVAAPFCAR